MKKLFTLMIILSALMCPTSIYAQGMTTDKEKINNTVMSLLNRWDRQAYLNIIDLMVQGLSYDTDGLSDIFNAKMADMKNGTTMNFNPSVFNGHFELVNNRWTRVADAGDMQFTFSDSDGKPCVATLTLSTTTKKMTINDVDITEEDLAHSREDIAEYPTTGILGFIGTIEKLRLLIEEQLVGVETLNVDLPEKIGLTFTQDGKEMMSADITFDLSTITNDWGLLTDGLTFSADMKFAKSSGTGTFELILKDTGYKSGTGINFDFTAKDTGTQLLSFKVSMPGTFRLLDFNDDLDPSFGFQSLNIDVDVMGSVQLKGSVSDFGAFMKSFSDDSDEARETRLFASRRAATEMSDQMKIEFFYDGFSKASGYLTLCIDHDADLDDDDDAMISSLVPIIHFNSDNSTYTCQEYFTPENFPDIQNAVNQIIDDASALLNGLKNKLNQLVGISQTTNLRTVSLDNDQLNPTGQKAGTHVAVYTLDGRLCTSDVADGEGKASVQLQSLGRGVYILKSPAGAKKFAVR